MKILKNGFKISGSIIIAAIISFFLCVSINVICSALFTREIGYTAYVYSDESCENLVTQYDFLYTDNADGTDTQKTDYENMGYTVNAVKVRSSLEGSGKVLFLTVTQVLSLIMVVAFASNSVYKLGSTDANLVKTGHLKKDLLKGFKIGLIGNAPFFVLYLLIIVMACGLAPKFYTVWYAFLNSHYYSLIICTVKNATDLSQLNILQYVLLFLIQFIVPLISAVTYVLGFKDINISEKIVYKRKVD